MEKILHQITHTEIRYGMIALRKTDGTAEFFSKLPSTLTVILKKKKLYERHVGEKKIWMGVEAMRRLNPYDVVSISKKGRTIIME